MKAPTIRLPVVADEPRRPRRRSECPTEGPCPWLSCRYHLLRERAAARLANEDALLDDLAERDLASTCALAAADAAPDGLKQREVAALIGTTPQFVDQVEGSRRVRRALRALEVEP